MPASLPRFPLRVGIVALVLGFAGPLPATTAATLQLEAGPHDRTNTPVSVAWTRSAEPIELRSADGGRIPVQISGGRAWFVEPGLAKGTRRRYEVRPATPGTPGICEALRAADHVELRVRGRTALRYLAGSGSLPRADIAPEFRRGGYLHPVLTPSGRVVTDDYPPNHIHQHGLWWSWTKTSFEGRAPDFWNMGQRTGRTDFESLEATESGPVFAGFRSRQFYTDLLASPSKRVLNESWTVRLLAAGGGAGRFHTFDLESEQRCATDSPLQLPKYHYGGFAFRGLWRWNGPTNVLYLDANRVTDRVAANATRPRWFWMGGPAEGATPGDPAGTVGLAILGNPGNFRAPQPLRVHPTEPYTAWSPSQLGDWEIRPGEPYVSRYRVIVLDGPPDATELDRLWNDYAEPPVARIESN